MFLTTQRKKIGGESQVLGAERKGDSGELDTEVVSEIENRTKFMFLQDHCLVKGSYKDTSPFHPY